MPRPSPFTPQRLAQIEANDFPDYRGFTSAELVLQIHQRNIWVPNATTKRQYVRALQDSDEKDRRDLRQWSETEEMRQARREVLAKRHKLMLSSKFTAEPGRIGFFDCPPEIRNIIYDLAIFGIKRADYTGPELRALDHFKWTPELDNIEDDDCFHLKILSEPRRSYTDDRARPASVVEQHVLDAIATTDMLCAMSKESGYEARGVFWAQLSHGVSSDVTGL